MFDSALSHLQTLLQQRGVEPLLCAPILLPNERFFPDPWFADERGVSLVARRLLTYVGLGHLRVEVQLFPAEAAPTVAAWFAGIDGDVCKFGVNAAQLAEAEAIVGTLCHEVAHAYRKHHGLELADRDEEERATDLTTIYLGFGVLTTNASYLYRSSGYQVGHATVTRWSHAEGGYLDPQTMSRLLAAQVLLRGGRERRAIAQELETNQRAFFEGAFAVLDKESLARTLNVQTVGRSPMKHVPPPPFAAEPPPPRELSNEGLAVVRIPRNRAGLFALLGVAPFGLVACILSYRFGSSDGFATACLLVFGFAGFVLGTRYRTDYCAACDTIFVGGETQCRGCGGVVGNTMTETELAARRVQQLDD